MTCGSILNRGAEFYTEHTHTHTHTHTSYTLAPRLFANVLFR